MAQAYPSIRDEILNDTFLLIKLSFERISIILQKTKTEKLTF
jgi:hypothetical protein